jgi:hypothetical protein
LLNENVPLSADAFRGLSRIFVHLQTVELYAYERTGIGTKCGTGQACPSSAGQCQAWRTGTFAELAPVHFGWRRSAPCFCVIDRCHDFGLNQSKIIVI